MLYYTDSGTVDSVAAGTEVRGTEASAGADDEEIETIRCICNIYRDEGLMIQCDNCEVILTHDHVAVR